MFTFPIPRPFTAIASLATAVLTALASPAAALDTSVFYKLSTDFRGTGMPLDIVNGGPMNNFSHLAPAGNYSGQFWRLEPAGAGLYRLSTEFRGTNMCLDVVNGGNLNNLTHLTPCGNYSGQLWHITQDSGFYRLTTDFRGAGMCLDVFNGGNLDNYTHLTDCANYSGQFWSLTPTGRPAW
ncbi:RICIN domain-containing protein [Roseovarius indicus]|uniref:RICIN domain-containing protein n=1 Tax=Roseovarius indicus TaxID=540747 RepID=UPI0032EB5CD6